jgi:hypothetical protein
MADTPVLTLIQMDGDQHEAHRNIVNDWFKPGNALHYPLQVIVSIVGLPADDYLR